MIMKRKKGFTLIELLVVIAVIALLLAVITPALQKAKGKAQSVLCLSNIRQLHLAMALYGEANDDKCFDYNYSKGLYVTRLESMVDNMKEIRYCPTTKLEINTEPGSSFSNMAYRSSRLAWWENFIPNPNEGGQATEEFGSYAFNGWMYSKLENMNASDVPPEWGFGRMGVASGGLVPLFADATWIDLWPKHDTLPTTEIDFSKGDLSMGAIGGMFLSRHGNKKVNVQFLDGHAETVELSDLYRFKWHKEFKARGDIPYLD